MKKSLILLLSLGTLSACNNAQGSFISAPKEKVIFVTQGVHNGNFGSLSGADTFCNSDPGKPANYAKMQFKALLSGNNSTESGVDYYRADGTTLIVNATTTNLTFTSTTGGFYPTGTVLTNTISTESSIVWTGVGGSNCNNWKDATNSYDATAGNSSLNSTVSFPPNTYVAAGGMPSCDSKLHLYCVSQ